MTKAELVEEVARAAELTKKDSEVIVDEVFKNIIQALNRGEKIELRGFGSFRVRQRDARRGRNPAIRSLDRKSTRLNSSHLGISYAVFCLKKKKKKKKQNNICKH